MGAALPLLLPGPWELSSGLAAVGALFTQTLWALPGVAVAWSLASPRLARALKAEPPRASEAG